MTHAKGASTLADFQYQFNAVNNITQMIDGAGSHNYTYDSLDRLTAATHPNQANESYTYDDVGNRTASHQGSSYSYQAFNRLVTANANSYGYNANGNLTLKTDASGSWTYTWDYENELKQASLSGGVTVNYSYDALGRRIQRSTSSGATTKFVYDSADVVRDLDANGATIADYLNGPGIDNKIRQTVSATTWYFVTDHLGTTGALADASGTVSSSLSYDSFGNGTSGSASTRYTYTGREIDSSSGLMYYRARWYDPQSGRFISEDPIGFQGEDVNLYGYVGNMPVGFRDPTGLCQENLRCNIKVILAPIDITGGLFFHAYIVVQQSDEEKQIYFRAGPSADKMLEAVSDLYQPGTVDWQPGNPPNASVWVFGSCQQYLKSLRETEYLTNRSGIRYGTTSTNSNAYVSTALERAGFQPNDFRKVFWQQYWITKPVGWGTKLPLK